MLLMSYQPPMDKFSAHPAYMLLQNPVGTVSQALTLNHTTSPRTKAVL